MDAHLPNVCTITQSICLLRCTPKTRDIKWTHICRMSTLINALPRKLVILNNAHLTNVYLNQCTFAALMSALINALPRKLVILNGRTFA